MKAMNITPSLLLLIVLVVFVSETEQAGPFGMRLTAYADSACTRYMAESHVGSAAAFPCTPFSCSPYDGYYATVNCSDDLSVYPKEETIGVALFNDACQTLLFRYLVAPNATQMCLLSAMGYYYYVTTNDCPTRTVVDVYQFKLSNGACATQDRHWDGNVGQCTLGVSYYADAICPVAPPVTPPVTPPVDAPVIAPQVAPVTPISEPVDASQPLEAPVTAPVKTPKPRLSFGNAGNVNFVLLIMLVSLLSAL